MKQVRGEGEVEHRAVICRNTPSREALTCRQVEATPSYTEMARSGFRQSLEARNLSSL